MVSGEWRMVGIWRVVSSEWRVVGFVDGNEVHFHIGGARPLDEAAGEGDDAALVQDDGQAAFAGIALPDGVGGDHSHAPAWLEETKDASVERCAEVSCAAVRGIGSFEPVAVFVAEVTTNFEATHEGWIAEDDVETAVSEWRMANSEWWFGLVFYSPFAIRYSLEHFGKLQRPVEEAVLRGERFGLRDGLGMGAAREMVGDDLRGNALFHSPFAIGQSLKKRGGPEVAGLTLANGAWRVASRVEATLLFLDMSGGVIGNVLQCGVLGGKLCDRAAKVERHRKLPSLQVAPFAAIAFFKPTCNRFVVAACGRESFVGDALFQNLEVEDADERIPAADAVVEERQRLAGAVGFQPQRHAAELDRQRIFVHAVDAVGDDIADRLAHPLGGGFVFAGADAGEYFAEPSGRRQQEMPRTAGGVEDAHAQQSVLRE